MWCSGHAVDSRSHQFESGLIQKIFYRIISVVSLPSSQRCHRSNYSTLLLTGPIPLRVKSSHVNSLLGEGVRHTLYPPKWNEMLTKISDGHFEMKIWKIIILIIIMQMLQVLIWQSSLKQYIIFKYSVLIFISLVQNSFLQLNIQVTNIRISKL